MTSRYIPSREEVIKQSLNSKHYHENALFCSNTTTPDYWKLSDLAFLYPNIFDVKKPISSKTINRMKDMVIHAIPEFKTLTKQPVHILTIKDTYNIYTPGKQQVKTVKNKTNQELTNVACEYLFRQFNGTEFEQAYFLYPNKSVQELIDFAQELKFEKIRDQIAGTSNLLSAIINRAQDATKTSFSEVWSLMWRVLYNTKSMDELRELYNIKTSPIDYMKPKTLIFINSLLQDVVLKFANKNFYTIADIYKEVRIKAFFAREQFRLHGSTPEAQLMEKNSYRLIEKIRGEREKFWRANYPISLQQR